MGSLRLGARDVVRFPGSSQGDWTLAYWERALASEFSSRTFYEPLFNTLLVCAVFTVLTLAIGTLLAWLVVRTDLSNKGPIGALVVLPYILPSWTLALAWVTLFRHDGQDAAVQGVLQSLTGIAVPDWFVYGPVPIILVLVVNYVAFAYLLAAAAFSTIDSSLEESAEIHGATRLRAFRRITVPLVLPAVGSAFILTFAAGLGTFGVPAYLGMPVGYEVMSTWLYGNMRIGRAGDAFVLAVVLVALAAFTVYLNTLLVGRRRQFTTITGKGHRRQLISLGRWRQPLSWAIMIGTAVVGLLPILLMVIQSLQRRLGQYSFSNFTLDYWIAPEVASFFRGALRDPRVLEATMNTLYLGLSVGAITVVAGLLIGYAIARGRGSRLARVLEQMSFLPYIIPGVAFGAIYLTMWATPWGPLPALYGTMALLILAASVYRLPYAARTGTSAMMQVGQELEEAAKMHGASFLTTIRRVLIPLTKQGLFVGFILVFVGVTKDLSLFVMLASSRTEVLSVVALGHTERGLEQIAYAIAVMVVAFVLLGVAVARRVSGAESANLFRNSKEGS